MIALNLILCLFFMQLNWQEAVAGDIYVDDDPQMVRAQELICNDKMTMARAFATKLLRTHPKNIQLLNLRAFIDGYLCKYEESETDLSIILNQDPDNIAALSRRSFARLNLKKYKPAIEDLNKLIELLPDDVPSLSNRGRAYSFLGEKDKAKADFDTGGLFLLNNEVILAPNKEVLQNLLARINAQMTARPKESYLAMTRARCHLKLGKYEKGIEDAGLALTLTKSLTKSLSTRVRFIRANLYSRAGQTVKAIDDYSYVIDQSVKGQAPQIVDWDYVPYCPENLSADKWQRRIIKIENVYVNRARLYAKEKNYLQAVDDCTKALKLNKHLVLALEVRAAAYRALGKPDLSLADYQKAVTITNGRQDLILGLAHATQNFDHEASGRTDLILSLSGTLASLNQKDQAISILNELITNAPKDKRLYLARAQAFLKAGNNKEAIKDANKLLTLAPQDPASLRILADCQAALKQYKQAIENYSKAVALGGGANVIEARANTYEKMGNQAKAQRDRALSRQLRSGKIRAKKTPTKKKPK
ncbi:MAG: tetratricopeptide repeat protein [Candidatus Obscuribacterales bacterium]|nr:tetratricopeptide repeat protein [Candidatus Obscuribacterales bacterium]